MDRLSKALEKARADRASVVQPGAATESQVGLHDGTVPRFDRFGEVSVRSVDAAHLEAHRILSDRAGGNDPAVRAFKLLRTQVLQRMRSNGWETLVVTSPTQGNGKTVTAINLAISLARQARENVLLADLDLLQPSIHKYICADPFPGISDYISGDTSIADILFSPSIPGLTVLPGREAFPHSAEALLHPKTISLIGELRSRYAGGLIVLDMPPVLATDDVVAFSAHWDAALVVVEDGRTTDSDLRRCLELLKGKPIIGTVLTKSHEVLPDYGY